MKSYTERRNLYAKLSRDSSSDNLSFGDQMMNDSDRTIANIKGGRWPWLSFTDTITTTADTYIYPTPMKVRKIVNGYVTVGENEYQIGFIFDSNQWNRIIAADLGTSDYALFAFVEDNQISLQPGTASAGNTITIRGRRRLKDLSIADYTTGTITTATNGDKTITGSGTTWTAQMAGRWLKIDDGDAANSGDGHWYEISSVTSATELELMAPYDGNSISGGSATYKIGS